jgi:AraC-like DNA-binding protein
MSIITEERPSDSPYVETITRGRTAGDGWTIRPAEVHWHMVLLKLNGNLQLLVVGPWTSSGVISYGAGAELLWIKFKLGIYMPHLPVRDYRDVETALPNATSRSFWLKGSAWQFPDYENLDTFINRLAREEVLVRDPVVDAALRGGLQDEISPRTVRHRFLQATGVTQGQIRQMKRAQQAATLLEQGASILDTVFETGYFDQSHLTRSLKQLIGYTPAQIAHDAPAPGLAQATETAAFLASGQHRGMALD